MADALRFSPLLMVLMMVIAVDGAAAAPVRPGLNLQSMDSVRFDEPAWTWRDPVLGRRLFQDDVETLPSWSLPFGNRADDRDRRGFQFSVRPGRGLKATAKLRF